MKKFLLVSLLSIFLIVILAIYNSQLRSKLPTVERLIEFENGATDIDPNTTELSFIFTEEMNTYYSNFEIGPLGEDYSFRILDGDFSDDKKTYKIRFKLEPNKKYQLEIGVGFRTKKEVRINPYLIEFTTGS